MPEAGTEFQMNAKAPPKKLYKCFECGRIYEDEASALKCHNAPIQLLLKQEGKKKPRFLGA